jgi:acyl carrier protein
MTETDAPLCDRLKQIVVSTLMLDATPGKLHEDDNLGDVLGVDSVSFLEILVSIEEELAIEIKEPDLSMSKYPTIRSLAELVSNHMEPRGNDGA